VSGRGHHRASQGSKGERRNRRTRKAGARDARREKRGPKTELDRLLDDPNGLANANPLMAEIAASAIVASWPEYAAEGEGLADVLGAVFAGFAERGGRNELALLHAMLPMLPRWPPDLLAEAAAAIEALRGRGRVDPPWAEVVGSPAFVEAWARTDDWGDATVVAATFQHAGWPPHVVAFACDHTYGGLIRETTYDRDGGKGPDAFLGAGERPPRSLNEQDLAGLLWRGTLGLEDPDSWPGVPVDEGAASGAPLLLARTRVLPWPRFEPPPYITVPERKQLVREFVAASWPEEPEGVRIRSPRLRPARDVAGAIVNFTADQQAADILRCTPGALAEWLHHTLPIELGADLDEDAVLDAVGRWVRFTGARTARAPDRTERLLEVVGELEPGFRAIVQEMGGPARALLRAMVADGVDVADQGAIDDWLERFNRLPRGARDRILGPLSEPA
jgi:hypothetical protein